MSGNPVKIGDGCATVKGYEFPKATIPPGMGRREQGWKPEVRISVQRHSSRFCSGRTNFSVKEKDETCPSAVWLTESVESLHSPFWRR
jgi:hypothetical protein